MVNATAHSCENSTDIGERTEISSAGRWMGKALGQNQSNEVQTGLGRLCTLDLGSELLALRHSSSLLGSPCSAKYIDYILQKRNIRSAWK